ncbi:MAG: hypothetical protein MK209_05095, partial [Planctomycetes bacterium]|nr:hypothetical protein [Planctomycetota bacterium]
PTEPQTGETQEPAPLRRSRIRSAELPPNHGDALAFLAQLIASQRGGEDFPTVRGFRMEFDLRDFNPERGMNQLEVRVDYRAQDLNADPPALESIRLLANDATYNEKVSKGLDDAGYWLRDGKGKLITLESKEYAQDREAIDDTLIFSKDFLLLFDLDQIRKRAGGLKLMRIETGSLLVGQLERRQKEIWKFELFVPKDKEFPTELVLQLPQKKKNPDGEKEETAASSLQYLIYQFGEWQTHAGRRLPSFIDEFHGRSPIAPRRSVDVKRFLWRDLSEVKTSRNDE